MSDALKSSFSLIASTAEDAACAITLLPARSASEVIPLSAFTTITMELST